MYQGKFDQKSRQSSASVKELLAQREQEAAARAAAKSTAKPTQQSRPASQNPARPASQSTARPASQGAARPNPQSPAQRPAPAAAQQSSKRPAPQAEPAKPQKRGPRLGGVIFYTLYFMFILVFFVATFIGLTWLNGWLVDYQASQPTVKAEQVFQQLFASPDWGALYEASGAKDSAYEGKEEFVTYMNEKVGGAQLSYLSTSNGLSDDKKYNVLMGDDKIASFTLTDKNNLGDLSLDNLEDVGKVSDWQLGSVEVFFTRSGSYRVVKMNGHRALVNGVELDDSMTIQIATTKAEEYLPAGTTGTSMCTQEVTGLFALPTVTVFDDKGSQMEVTYDADTRTFTERTSSNTMSADQETAIRGAAETFCKWMIKEVTNRATVAKYFDASTDTYSEIVKTTELWMQDHGAYEFADVKITDFALYTDDLFSARISLNLNVTRTDGTIREFPFVKSMFFRKNDSGSWLCIKATNIDISQPVGKVRLTFMADESTVLYTNMYQTDAKEVITPAISPIPEGKVFSGWARKDVDEKGVTTWSLIFQPDESGHVSIPEGNTLEPMTLYPLFEDAGAASSVPAETAPQTTEGGV